MFLNINTPTKANKPTPKTTPRLMLDGVGDDKTSNTPEIVANTTKT